LNFEGGNYKESRHLEYDAVTIISEATFRKEYITIIRLKRICELGTTLEVTGTAHIVPSSQILFILMM
jgi:hypothetical protein